MQLHLGTNETSHMVDTLVMSNLGYFQLKAEPGIYNLSLAPGRSRQLYNVVPPDALPAALEVSLTCLRLEGSLTFSKVGICCLSLLLLCKLDASRLPDLARHVSTEEFCISESPEFC